MESTKPNAFCTAFENNVPVKKTTLPALPYQHVFGVLTFTDLLISRYLT